MHHTAAVRARLRVLWPTLLVALAADPTPGQSADTILTTAGVSGGLCVQVGAGDGNGAAGLARTGRFLVHVLKADAAAVDETRRVFQSQGIYGLVSVDRFNGSKRLPYTENLVNLLLIEGRSGGDVSPAEMIRVLCPHGVVLVRQGSLSESDLKGVGLEDVRTVHAGGNWLTGHKPWPPEMDEWPHPRHAADGNAVSRDKLVGPPRRIRWVAGPPQEISNLVTSAGRNFYAGLLARDGFNGLRLWRHALNPSPARGGYNFRFAPGSVRPVAAGKWVLGVTDEILVALDGATGEEVREYPEAGTPHDILHVDATVITIDKASVRAWTSTAAGCVGSTTPWSRVTSWPATVPSISLRGSLGGTKSARR